MEINNKNLFCEELPASGESFIGRKKLLSDIIEKWNDSDGCGSQSVVGLNRMGKTSFVSYFENMIKSTDANAICIKLQLKQSKFPLLIQRIMKQILDEYGSRLDPTIRNICEKTRSIRADTELDEYDIISYYEHMLRYMEKIGQKYLLIIDEFDSAKICWKDEGRYFDALRDSVQSKHFLIIVSRRPLEVIEMDSYGQSCFHNVFPEINICAFDEDDMREYYKMLEENYHISLDENDRKSLEEYTGFCPTLLTAVGYRLAADAINNREQKSIENICTEANFYNNSVRHYKEFLKRMQEDGLWDDVVRILMGISPTLVEAVGRNSFDRSRLQIMEVKGYLRKQNGQYVVFSDDFSAWAQTGLFRSEIDTIYSTIIEAEVSIREMLRKEMPIIWSNKYKHSNWEDDFMNDDVRVPESVKFFTKTKIKNGNPDIRNHLRTAKKYNPTATPVDAMTMKVKLLLIKEYWEDGIKTRFNSEKYSEWQDCFESLGEIRNPIFHGNISVDNVSNNNYHLLKNVNDDASRIINQLSQ